MTHPNRYAMSHATTASTPKRYVSIFWHCAMVLGIPCAWAQGAPAASIPPASLQAPSAQGNIQSAPGMGSRASQDPVAMPGRPIVAQAREPQAPVVQTIPPTREPIAATQLTPTQGANPAVTPRGPGAQNPVTTNDNGDALTPPDLSLYEGQLAAMQKLQRDNLELKLELEQAELKAKLRMAQNGGKAPRDTGGADSVDAPIMPMVTNLTSTGDNHQALITMPGYGQLTVRAGDVLPNHWKVVVIDDGGVVVTEGMTRNAKRVRLPFAAGSGNPA